MNYFTPEQNRKLTELYPYLIPSNLFTDSIPQDVNTEYIKCMKLSDKQFF